MTSPERLHALRDALRGAGERLRALPLERRANAIAAATRLLLEESTAHGAALREALPASTGLSPAVIERGLRTTLALFERDSLMALHASATGERRAQLAAVVLAGNVFSAVTRPLLLPLLCGTAVLAKASSADDVLPQHLKLALDRVDPVVGAACEVVTFGREADDLHAALLRGVDVLSAYGSDRAIAALAARTTPECRVIAHGHGLGVTFIAREALGSEHAVRMIAGRAAIDIAAYDQRGCLSPHAVFVQAGGAADARRFARVLGEALQGIERELPRGALSEAGAAAQLQWRGVAAAIGVLHKGDTWAVSYEERGPLRVSPGYRNVTVYDCDSTAALAAKLSPLGTQLKALGVAGAAARGELSECAPYVCAVGAMQTPPLDAPLDGLHALAGYVN
jgi:hypothetical protein